MRRIQFCPLASLTRTSKPISRGGRNFTPRRAESAEKYLQTKLTELQARVEKSEAVLNAYRRQRGIVADSSDDNNKIVMGRLIDLNKALTEAETQRITLDADAHLIATRDYDALPAVTNDTLIQTLRQQQARIQAEYASMADQYKPNYPPLAELAAELKETQSRLNRGDASSCDRCRIELRSGRGARERTEPSD